MHVDKFISAIWVFSWLCRKSQVGWICKTKEADAADELTWEWLRHCAQRFSLFFSQFIQGVSNCVLGGEVVVVVGWDEIWVVGYVVRVYASMGKRGAH